MTDDNSIQIYQSPDGETCVDVRFERETVWLTQRQMGEVFDTTPENVLMHLKNIYKTGELDRDSTAKDFLVVRTECARQVKRQLKHYNQDAVISVGYRANSKRGVSFRIWATQRSPITDNGVPVINDTGLAALTLLVAESDPKQKETLIKLIMNLLCEHGV